jgi:hypothetical protein
VGAGIKLTRTGTLAGSTALIEIHQPGQGYIIMQDFPSPESDGGFRLYSQIQFLVPGFDCQFLLRVVFSITISQDSIGGRYPGKFS